MSVSSRPQSDGPLAAVGGLLTLMAGLVLVVACLNLANLLLARGAARRKEIAIRQALGSGRRRIVQQLLVEGMTLPSIGAAFGLIASWWTARALAAWLAQRRHLRHRSRRRAVAATDRSRPRSSRSSARCCSRSVRPGRCRGPIVTDDLKLRAGTCRRDGGDRIGAGHRRSSRSRWRWSTAGGLFVRAAMNAAAADAGYPLERQIVVGARSEPAGLQRDANARRVCRGARPRARDARRRARVVRVDRARSATSR